MPGRPFEILQEQDGESRSIRLSGELDLAVAPILEAAICDACDDGTRQLVIDLADLDFIDSIGLQTLVVAANRCQERRTALTLIRPTKPGLQRVLNLTGLDDGALPVGQHRIAAILTRRFGLPRAGNVPR